MNEKHVQKSKSKNGGKTCIELDGHVVIIALIIISVLVALAIPHVGEIISIILDFFKELVASWGWFPTIIFLWVIYAMWKNR